MRVPIIRSKLYFFTVHIGVLLYGNYQLPLLLGRPYDNKNYEDCSILGLCTGDGKENGHHSGYEGIMEHNMESTVVVWAISRRGPLIRELPI